MTGSYSDQSCLPSAMTNGCRKYSGAAGREIVPCSDLFHMGLSAAQRFNPSGFLFPCRVLKNARQH